MIMWVLFFVLSVFIFYRILFHFVLHLLFDVSLKLLERRETNLLYVFLGEEWVLNLLLSSLNLIVTDKITVAYRLNRLLKVFALLNSWTCHGFTV